MGYEPCRHPCRLIALVVLAGWLGACGGSDASPTAPPAPILPNYTGIWAGTYTVTSCTQTGTIAAANICGSRAAPEASLPFELNLIQQENTIIQGTFVLGGLAFSMVPSTLTSAGTVSVSGSAPLNELTIVTILNLTTPITGTLSQVWSASTFTGQVNVRANIGAVMKTGSGGSVASRG